MLCGYAAMRLVFGQHSHTRGMGQGKKSEDGLSGTDSGKETAATWQYYQDMHEVLGGWLLIDPPLLVASFTPEEDPLSLLLVSLKD